jgi:hypothetical protein
MGRTRSCLDNAVAESFFATLKVELVDRHHYRTRAEARVSIFRWIAWYNQRRLHSTNDYLAPVEWQHQHRHDHPLPSPLAAQSRCPARRAKSRGGLARLCRHGRVVGRPAWLERSVAAPQLRCARRPTQGPLAQRRHRHGAAGR